MLPKKLNLTRTQSISVPGDKSLSHRAVLFSALASGSSQIIGFLEGEDPLNTLRSFAKLGVSFERQSDGSYVAKSEGPKALTAKPGTVLDFGNAGTGIRLSAGLLSGIQGLDVQLTGDESLQKRPMARILAPLQEMGAKINAIHANDRAPLMVHGSKLRDYSYSSPIASAQVKSALMLAAIASEVSLDFNEPEKSRDHTENMVRFLGGDIQFLSETQFKMNPPYQFQANKFQIPGDISSAAFFIVLALASEGEPTLIRNVGLNPSRIGILTVLKGMGGRIEIQNPRTACGEEIGDLLIFPSNLQKISIESALIPSIIDEIPILAIAGLFSKGGFSIRNASELRAKESDRILSVVSNLQKIGVQVREFSDGFEFDEVKEIHPAKILTYMDHRIAMSFSILSRLTQLPLEMDETSWVDTSFPGFFSYLQAFD